MPAAALRHGECGNASVDPDSSVVGKIKPARAKPRRVYRGASGLLIYCSGASWPSWQWKARCAPGRGPAEAERVKARERQVRAPRKANEILSLRASPRKIFYFI
jgi:hypothetical protein